MNEQPRQVSRKPCLEITLEAVDDKNWVILLHSVSLPSRGHILFKEQL